MGVLSLKVRIVDRGVVKTMQFDPATLVYDACTIIREKIPDACAQGQAKDYGLFLADDDPKKGVWMENGRTLEYYLVRPGDLLEFKKKTRTLRVRMLDGAVKTLMVDDSQPVAQLMVVICTRIGITNHDEYSITREMPAENGAGSRTHSMGTLNRKDNADGKSGFGTLTLGRSKEKKMELLRAKLHTDEELNWVDHSKTLREQGIDETETLLLRRKYFFSDTNVDSRDPVQLNLLYVQCRDGVIDGSHPVSKEEALQLAGLQCQIQFGDCQEPMTAKSRQPGWLDLREFLPKEYLKARDVDKRVMQHYRECTGMNELDAKVHYVQRCRSLKTYGVTFFLVKEKVKGKNKLVPRLLGINKESVMRVDEKTKDVIKEWPLEQVRRWAASPNTFTLDFGDYSDGYYSVQTADGEKIAQLIAGYIDIILKKKRAKDHLGIEGDEGSTMLEDMVSPAKATLMSHGQLRGQTVEQGSIAIPGVIRHANGEFGYSTDSMQRAQFGAVSGQIVSAHPPPGQKVKVVDPHVRAQRALVGTIEASVKAVEDAERELDRKADLPPLGDDPASHRWRRETLEIKKSDVNYRLEHLGAATADILQQTGEVSDRVDHMRVGAAVSTISSNLPEMTRGVRTIAALMETDAQGDSLIGATRKLCGAFSDFLNAVNPDHKESRQTVLAAAGRVGDYSHAMIETIQEPSDEMKEFQDILIQLAKSVATSTAALVLKAKHVSAECDDKAMQDNVIHSATQCAFATSQLVACARVVAPTIESPACQEQLADAAKQVAKAIEQLVADAELACTNETSLTALRDAANQVSQALHALLEHIRTGPRRAHITQTDTHLESVMINSDRLIHYQGGNSEMVRQAKVLAEATTNLVSHIRGNAETAPVANRDRLLGAARNVADATTRMIDAAREVAAQPDSNEAAWKLQTQVVDLRSVTQSANAETLRRQAIRRLEQAARVAASAATQTIAAANASEDSSQHAQSAQQLSYECTDTAECIPRMITCIRHSQTAHEQRDEILAQAELVRVCTEALDPCQRLINASRAAAPNVADGSKQMQLTNSTQQLSEALAELRTALGLAQEYTSLIELEYAIEVTRGLHAELGEFHAATASTSAGHLAALPGETAEQSVAQLNQSTRTVGSSMAQMLSAAARGDDAYAGSSARDAAEGLRLLTASVHGVCATRQDAPRLKLIGAGETVMQHSLHLFEEVKVCLANPERPENQERLATVAKNVSAALRECLACMPGQQDIDAAIAAIDALIRQLSLASITTSSRTYQQVQDDLLRRASNLSEATSALVTSVGQPPNVVRDNVNRYVDTYRSFYTVTLEMGAHQQDMTIRQQMIDGLKSVSYESSRLLSSLRASSGDPQNASLKQQLMGAAKTVSDSINRLIDVCMAGAPWQKECDNALRSIQAVRPTLDYPTQSINDLSYFDCLEMVTDRSKHLGDGMTGIAHYAKEGDMHSFCTCVRQVADSVCGLAEGAAQAAYLVGVSEASSVPPRQGLIDSQKFARSTITVRQACERIISGHYTQQQIVDDATSIARHTSIVANMCRDASNATNNANAKRHFINCARDVASSTAQLIGDVKTLDQDMNDANKTKCARSAADLLTPLDALATFVQSSEFAGHPAKISANGRHAQEPIVHAGQHMLDASCDMIRTAKVLAMSPKDPPTWQQLADNSKVVSESIKRLVSAIRDKAPGQAECDEAIERINSLIKQLDQTSLAAINQSLTQRTDKLEKAFHEQTIASSVQIIDRLEPVGAVAKRHAEHLGHRVTDMMSFFGPMVDGVIGAASRSFNSKQQMQLLDQCKTVVECQLQLLYACKDAGGNGRATEYHANIDEASAALREALNDLLHSSQAAASEAGVVSQIIDSLSRSIAHVDEPLSRDALAHGATYVDCQTRMVRSCKEIARIAQEMLSKSYADASALGPLALDLSRHYAQLADDCRLICTTTNDVHVSARIRTAVQELGTACIEDVKRGGAVRAQPDDQYAKQDLSHSTKIVQEKVAAVLSALTSGSRGTQACINAAATVSGIIGDLDTTIMFATAGTLNPDSGEDHFGDHREAILKTAKALVEDTKALVAGAASSQEQLAVAAQNAVRTIVVLSDVVKAGAAALTSHNHEAQVLVINAVKDVAAALTNLISTTKHASGKSLSDPAMQQLKDAAKLMVTNVTSLLKTVKTVEDEHARGTRALEAAIEAITHEIKLYDGSDAPSQRLPPEELTRYCKPITDATAKTMQAGSSGHQQDVIVASNYARKAVSDLLHVTKSVAYSAESTDARYRALDAGRDVALKVRDLLQTLHMALQRPGDESRQILMQVSRSIAQSVTDLVSQAEMIKGSDWVDPSDPSVIAENELLGAANSIEAAAKKLSQLKARQRPKAADETLNFDEQILEAAKSIAGAVQALVKAASSAQRELVSQGRLDARPHLRTEDYQWSEGLISAARTVAAAVHSLCEAANALVQGHATEEKLISAAKQVASSTAHLLVACKVKADINSRSMQRLQAAGHAVKTATEHLVRAAKQSIEADDERTLVISQRMVTGIAQVMDAQEAVIKKERELDAARRQLHDIRRAKYKDGEGPADFTDF